MSGFRIAFDAPWFLLLLAALPLLWWFGAHSLAGLGRVRRSIALAMRCAVLVLIILALAELQLVRTSEKLTVMYLLDQSASIPPHQRQEMTDYVNAEVKKHRRGELGDRAGVIVFRRDATVAYPPVDDYLRLSREAEVHGDADHTNIEAALRLAMASFPSDAARRVVIATDGNENMGNALHQAHSMADAGVGIDVVPLRYPPRSDVAVERITVPSQIGRGQPFDLRVVLNNTVGQDAPSGGQVKGHLEVTRKSGESEKILAREPLILEPGKHVFSLREEIDSPDFYTYLARYIPDDPAQDAVSADNRATAFTHVRGQGQVLLIVDAENPGEFDFLIQRLRKENLHVTLQPSNQLFTSLAELQPFDAVILADVPRENFTAAQVKKLALNTQQMGSGLIMLGGPNSFGAGGWANSEVEAAMPLDFQIKNTKMRPPALALVIDRSGSMTGEKLAMAKAAASASVEVLSPGDYVSIIAFDTAANLVVPLTKKEDSTDILSRLDSVGAAGGTNMYPALTLAYEQLAQAADAGVRHIVLLTDGMTEGAGYQQLVEQMRKDQNVTLSTVAVGADADVKLLEQLARAGGGRFHQALSPSSLPRIFQQEARIVARPLIFQRDAGFQPRLTMPHEILKGISDALPPITGYVLTSKKENPLVEVAAISPVGPDDSTADNRTILAGWTYGLGKAVALTTDAGQRWASFWTSWPYYDKLFAQIVRWSMRPAGDQGKFSVATDLDGSSVNVTVTALDMHDEFVNFLNMTGHIVSPEMKPIELKLRQTAAGRYVGRFDAPSPGSYFLMLNPGPGMAPVLAGVNMPYSAEFLDREPNEGLLKALAALTPKGTTESGLLIADAHGQAPDARLEFDTFRHSLPKARSLQALWPELVLVAACIFFLDVLVRRVRLNFAALPRLADRAFAQLRNRQPRPAPLESIQRLRSRKAAISQQIASQRAGAYLEASADNVPADINPERSAIALQGGPAETESPYIDRLLEAKKKVRQQRN